MPKAANKTFPAAFACALIASGLATIGMSRFARAAGVESANTPQSSGTANAETGDSPWQLSKPSGKIGGLFQLYNQRFQGLPNYQGRLDGEVEFALSNGTYGFKALPWGWTRSPDAEGGLPRKTRFFGDFKEAWIERVGPYIDIRAGNQIFAWGTADQVNPTDVWNPRDLYDIFESPKLPLAALQIKVHPPELERVSLEVIATPFFRPSRLPLQIPDTGTQTFTLDDSRWFLPFPTSVINPGGSFAAPLQYQITEATYPSTWQGGARLRVTSVGGWDFSASYANLVESLPRFSFATQGNASVATLPVVVTLSPSFHRQQMWGLDGAGSVSLGEVEIGTRFEAAYFLRDNSRAFQASTTQQSDLLRDNYLHFVAGLDYTFKHKILGTVLYLNLQYVHYQRIGTLEQTPGQFSLQGLPDVLPWDRNLVLYWEDRIGQNSQFKFLGTFVASVQNRDGLISPGVQYAWTDNFKTNLSGEFFVGNSSGFFGQFVQNSRIDLGANFSF